MIALSSTIGARWLDPNFELIEAVADTGNGLVDLWETSPVRLESNQPNTDKIIDILFPGNPLLCCAWNHHRFDARLRTHWYKLSDLQFIVPNPMTARQGVTRQGKWSVHALSNTGPRRFLIVEFDFDLRNSAEEARLLERLANQRRDVRDLCAALLLHLAEKAPLALAVYSGGKSLQAAMLPLSRPSLRLLQRCHRVTTRRLYVVRTTVVRTTLVLPSLKCTICNNTAAAA